MPKLILKHKAEVLKEYPFIGDNMTIGSEKGNDVIIADKLVSMTHLQINRQGDQFFVRDLKSAFGTQVNGVRINTVTEIRDSDVIQLGEHTLVFKNPLASNSTQDTKHSTVSQSISSFLHEVKEAVIQANAGEGAASSLPQAESAPVVDILTEAPRGQNGGVERSAKGPRQQDNAARALDAEEARTPSSTPAGAPAPSPDRHGGSPYYLLAIYGPYLGRKYQLNFGETKVGRDTKLNDIVIRKTKKGEVDASISRRHATFSYREGSFFLTDKRSRSRTYVNQVKLSATDEVRLMPGDEIEIVSDQQSTIFRLVREGHWDFSPPKRAGQWWLRYQLPAMNVVTAAALLCGLIINFMSWRSCSVVTDVPDPFAVTAKTFTKIEIGEKTAEGQSFRSAKIPPVSALADLNGDGRVDLVVMLPSGLLMAIDGKARQKLWEIKNLVLNRAYPPAVADLNNNQMADLIALTADRHLVAIDGLHGAEIWMSPFSEQEMIGPPVVADFNGDSYLDVATISVDGRLKVGYSRVFNMEWVDIDVGLPCHAPLSAGDLDRDGDDEIIIGTERGIVLIYNGVERRLLAGIDINEELNKLKGSLYEGNSIRHPVGLADLNGDRIPDLVISSTQGNLLCMAVAETPKQESTFAHALWWANVDTGGQHPAEFSYPFVLGDVDHDKLADVIMLSADGSVYAFRGRGVAGQQQPPLWRTAADTSAWVSPPRIYDFNKDAAAEVVLFNSQRELKMLNGKTGELLWRDSETITNATDLPVLADFSKDTFLDMVLLSAEGTVYQFETTRRVLKGSIIWGQLHGTSTNTSQPATSDPTPGRYYHTMIVTSLLMAAIFGGNGLVRYRRWRLAKQ